MSPGVSSTESCFSSSHSRSWPLLPTLGDAPDCLAGRTVLFISEDGGRSWYQAPDASDVPTSR